MYSHRSTHDSQCAAASRTAVTALAKEIEVHSVWPCVIMGSPGRRKGWDSLGLAAQHSCYFSHMHMCMHMHM